MFLFLFLFLFLFFVDRGESRGGCVWQNRRRGKGKTLVGAERKERSSRSRMYGSRSCDRHMEVDRLRDRDRNTILVLQRKNKGRIMQRCKRTNEGGRIEYTYLGKGIVVPASQKNARFHFLQQSKQWMNQVTERQDPDQPYAPNSRQEDSETSQTQRSS